MSYRIALGPGFTARLADLVQSQIGLALDTLGTEDDESIRVFKLRRRLKRVRGALLLARRFAPDVARGEDRRYRDLGRMLSPARDADMAPRTLDAVIDAHRASLAPHAFVAIRQQLAGSGPRSALPASIWPDVTLRLNEGLAGLDALRALPDSSGGTRELSAAVTDIYRAARQLWRKASDSGETEALHALRKPVKYHLMHLKLLDAAWPEAMRARAEASKGLAGLLGDLHDRDMLRSAVAELEPGTPEETAERDLLGALLDREIATRRVKGLSEAGLLFAEKPKAYRRRLGAYLEAADPETA